MKKRSTTYATLPEKEDFAEPRFCDNCGEPLQTDYERELYMCSDCMFYEGDDEYIDYLDRL